MFRFKKLFTDHEEPVELSSNRSLECDEIPGSALKIPKINSRTSSK